MARMGIFQKNYLFISMDEYDLRFWMSHLVQKINKA